ncbi:hypothetical protein [Metabacillus herbersteinensis]
MKKLLKGLSTILLGLLVLTAGLLLFLELQPRGEGEKGQGDQALENTKVDPQEEIETYGKTYISINNAQRSLITVVV